MTTMHLIGLLIAVTTLVLTVVLYRGATNLERRIDAEQNEKEDQ